MISSASAACSTVTCSSVRVAGSIVVSRELVPVHLAEALQALELLLVVRVLGRGTRALAASSFR